MPERWLAYNQYADVLGILSHPARLQIIDKLGGGECDVNSLREEVGLTQAAVSQHLALLRAQQLVFERREGRKAIYWLAHPDIVGWLRHGVELLHGPVQAWSTSAAAAAQARSPRVKAPIFKKRRSDQ